MNKNYLLFIQKHSAKREYEKKILLEAAKRKPDFIKQYPMLTTEEIINGQIYMSPLTIEDKELAINIAKDEINDPRVKSVILVDLEKEKASFYKYHKKSNVFFERCVEFYRMLTQEQIIYSPVYIECKIGEKLPELSLN